MEFPVFSFLFSILSVFGNETGSVNRQVVNLRDRMLPPPIVPQPTLHNLCPKEANSTMLILRARYHKNTKQCYMIYSQGPCGNNMQFIPQDEMYGDCACIQDTERLLIYHKKSDQCYWIFQQAYCNRGYGLDIDRKGTPKCDRNRCKSLLVKNDKDVIRFNGQCAEVGKPTRLCNSNTEVVGFVRRKRLPLCIIPSRSNATRSIGVPSTPCDLGASLALDGRCSPDFEFD